MKRRVDRNQLRKQPKRYRMRASSAVNLPDLSVPKTAKKRKRRQKTERFRSSLALGKRIFLSPRWLSLALLAMMVYALVIIAQDKRFYLNYIPVDGLVSITPEEVIAASGLAGNHIFAAEPTNAAEKIAELPGVISTTVTLRWPNQVYIEVAEELPIMVWQEGGTEFGITQSGRLIPAGFSSNGLFKIISEMDRELMKAPPPEETEVLLEEGNEEFLDNEILTEEPVPPEEPEVSEIVETRPISPTVGLDESQQVNLSFIPDDVIVGAMQLREFRPTIGELFYRPSGGLSFEDDRGWRGYFGTGANMNQKLAIYEAIADYLQTLGIQPAYISVSNQEKPFYRTR